MYLLIVSFAAALSVTWFLYRIVLANTGFDVALANLYLSPAAKVFPAISVINFLISFTLAIRYRFKRKWMDLYFLLSGLLLVLTYVFLAGTIAPKG